MQKRELIELFERACHHRAEVLASDLPQRLFDGEGDGLAGFTVDRLGTTVVCHLLEGRSPAAIPILREVAERFLEIAQSETLVLWTHGFQAEDGSCQVLAGDPIRDVQVSEHGISYLTKPHEQRNAGFFIDMRNVRRTLSKNCNQQRVLNTFCFTGTLGIAAYVGGAAEVVQVDISRSALRWARANQELQKPQPGRLRVIPEDTRSYLRREGRRIARGHEPFDQIIIDPPAFGRSDRKPFILSRDLSDLVSAAIVILKEPGTLILTGHGGDANPLELSHLVAEVAKGIGRKIEDFQQLNAPSEDFTAPRNASTAMRGCSVTFR